MNIPLMMPNRGSTIRIDTAQTIMGWQHILNQSGINLILISAHASNIPRARNQCMDTIRDNPSKSIFMGWMDSDMVLPTNENTIKHLDKMAWYAHGQKDAVVCCDYRTLMADNEFQMREYRTSGTANQELDRRKHPIFSESFTDMGYSGASGFGLCFGYFPRDYIFHADTLGEDIHFWLDNKKTRLIRYNDFVPGHAKEVIL